MLWLVQTRVKGVGSLSEKADASVSHWLSVLSLISGRNDARYLACPWRIQRTGDSDKEMRQLHPTYYIYEILTKGRLRDMSRFLAYWLPK